MGCDLSMDLRLLPNNYSQALKKLEKTEKRLTIDSSRGEVYTQQIQDMFNRDIARKLSDDEIKYKGPIHYISHHDMAKSDSKTTPVRIVFNSSSNYKGHILNNYWAKGPDAYLNSLFELLIRFRENYYGYIGDIKKMYNSVCMSWFDQHCHRFLWRNMNTNVSPVVCCITAVNMGDRPSGTIATIALYKTAEMAEVQYPNEAKVIKKSSYVDDIVDSVETAEQAVYMTANITKILKNGNFIIKGWSVSCDNCDVDIDLNCTEKVLGINWEPKSDVLRVPVKLNFSALKNGIRTEPYITIHNIQEKIPTILTKRNVMSQLRGIYDPLGLLTPFTVRGKILLRKLWMLKFDWDDPLPPVVCSECMNFFKDMLELPLITFQRCLKPQEAIGNPILVIFSDASTEAFGCCAFVVWKMRDNSQKATLLASKGKIVPLKTISIVRLELSAAVLSKRLRTSILQGCQWNLEQIIHIVYSEIVRAMISKESYGFKIFVATRVREIQSETSPSEWYWIDTKSNIADILTKGVHPHLLSSSNWQCGPKLLQTPIELWPLKQETTIVDLPERIEVVLILKKNAEQAVIDINRFSNYMRLICTMARILCLKQKLISYSLKNIGIQLRPPSYKLCN